MRLLPWCCYDCFHGYCHRYKILFLDVLFPLSVNKFIFVDADQVSWMFP